MPSNSWETAVQALRDAERVAVFTGAGISAASGIPTFRDADGFWRRFPPEQFANWRGLSRMALKEPRTIAEFVWNIVHPIAEATPNEGHHAIAEIERRVETSVITQNIDGLHQAAGSRQVHEIHGSLLEVIHVNGKQVDRTLSRDDLTEISQSLEEYLQKERSLLSLIGILRRYYPVDWSGWHQPNLVLFGDAMAEPDWSDAQRAAVNCDLFLSVGTSGTVYPAASLPEQAELYGATLISVAPERQPGLWLEGPADEVLPKLVQEAWSGE